ncbi:hypothetical protein AB0957_36265, partial [Streptomyces zhihengii]|uniref:hypothetical protein n=1 Tax=Streptomyces zhihengii TaxID=1818004 RepID=UPI003494D1CA
MTRPAHDPAAGRRLLVRVLLGALAAAVAAIPFLAAWQHRTDRFAVEEQLGEHVTVVSTGGTRRGGTRRRADERDA